MQKVKILLVDDHEIVRDGIKSILQTDKNINVVAEAKNGVEAIKYLEKNAKKIDVALIDINMPQLNGVDTVEIIRKLHKHIKVLALSMHKEETYITNMIKAGALGYILKDSGGDNLIEAVKTVAQGKNYYCNDVSLTLINNLIHPKKSKKEHYGISKRELEILQLLVDGKNNTEIAKLFGISHRTVETHRRNIMKKMNVNNAAKMLTIALKEEIVK